MKRRSIIAGLSLTVALAGFSPATHAQAYPNQPIRIVVPFPPGGPADILSRTIGQKLSQSLGQPVIIDNRAGAGGTIGADAAAKSAPNGYTLVMGFVGTHAINPSVYAKMPYDSVKDFEPVARVADVSVMLVVHPSVPASSLEELIKLAKSKPGDLTFASPGRGTPQHLAGEMFNTMAGVRTLHVPYKGAVPALTDLLGGQVSMMFTSMPPALPFVKSGKLRALGVTSSARSLAAPDTPTLAQAGLPGYVVNNWYGIFAPRGTPREIIVKLNAEILKILNMPDVKETLSAQGAEPFGSTPEQLGTFLAAEIDKWAKVIKSSGLQLE